MCAESIIARPGRQVNNSAAWGDIVLLPIAFFLIFRYAPMAYILSAFKKNNIIKPPWEVEWAKNNGFEWFIKAFKNRDFLYALRNTVTLNVLARSLYSP